MAKMKPPAIPEQPVPVRPDEALRRLFAACAGKDFEARRDTAMIMLLLDSGASPGRAGRPPGGRPGLRARRGPGDWQGSTRAGAAVRPQDGRGPGPLPPDQVEHVHVASPWLWLGQKGPLTATGLAQMLWRRGRQDGHNRRATQPTPAHALPHPAAP